MITFTFIHSIFGWLILFLLFMSVLTAFIKYNKTTACKATKIHLFTMIVLHTQLIIGLVQYFMSPKVTFAAGFMKDTVTRFFALEHPLLMIIGTIVITIGYLKSKKKISPNKTIAVYYLIGLILVASRFPWQYLTITF